MVGSGRTSTACGMTAWMRGAVTRRVVQKLEKVSSICWEKATTAAARAATAVATRTASGGSGAGVGVGADSAAGADGDNDSSDVSQPDSCGAGDGCAAGVGGLGADASHDAIIWLTSVPDSSSTTGTVEGTPLALWRTNCHMGVQTQQRVPGAIEQRDALATGIERAGCDTAMFSVISDAKPSK